MSRSKPAKVHHALDLEVRGVWVKPSCACTLWAGVPVRGEASAESQYHAHVRQAEAQLARERRRGRRGASSVPAPRPVTPPELLPPALR